MTPEKRIQEFSPKPTSKVLDECLETFKRNNPEEGQRLEEAFKVWAAAMGEDYKGCKATNLLASAIESMAAEKRKLGDEITDEEYAKWIFSPNPDEGINTAMVMRRIQFGI